MQTYPQLHQFLIQYELDKYITKFVDEGLINNEDIMQITASDLKEMKLPIGNRNKILKGVVRMNQEEAWKGFV